MPGAGVTSSISYVVVGHTVWDGVPLLGQKLVVGENAVLDHTLCFAIFPRK